MLAGDAATSRASFLPSAPMSRATCSRSARMPASANACIHARMRVSTVSTSVPSRSKISAPGSGSVREPRQGRDLRTRKNARTPTIDHADRQARSARRCRRPLASRRACGVAVGDGVGAAWPSRGQACSRARSSVGVASVGRCASQPRPTVNVKSPRSVPLSSLGDCLPAGRVLAGIKLGQLDGHHRWVIGLWPPLATAVAGRILDTNEADAPNRQRTLR